MANIGIDIRELVPDNTALIREALEAAGRDSVAFFYDGGKLRYARQVQATAGSKLYSARELDALLNRYQ